MNQSKIVEAIALIEPTKTVGLVTHREGDGDAFGSMLALANILKIMGKEVIFFSNEPLIPLFDFMNAELEYQPSDKFVPVDLLIALDANGVDRFTLPDVISAAQKSGAKILGLDHHEPGNLGQVADLYLGDPNLSSTSELVLNLAQGLNLKVDKNTANLLLIGIETDTRSFQNPNTTGEAFEATAELIKSGARLNQVIAAIESGRSVPSLKLLGLAIKNLKLDEATGVGISILTEPELQKLGLAAESTTGIANFLDQLKDVGVIVVLEERAGGMVRGSMRANSSDVDVNKIAQKFGGGGHIKAAGFLVKKPANQIAKEILAAVPVA